MKLSKFKVHKSILAARSDVFKAMFGSQMKENECGEVTFEDLTSSGLKTILFIYAGVVDEAWKVNTGEIVDAADRYSINFLKTFVDKNLHLTCNTENASNMLQLTIIHALSLAFKNISEYIQSNFNRIANVS